MTKILLVEDDKSLREIYGVRLLAEGYDIVSAGDGEEALAMAIKERPALILSDVMMPKISGFDMLDILRSTTETKDVKVIIMTALSSEDQRKRGEQLGADRYLVKSQVGIEDVVRTVHEVLGDIPGVGTDPVPTAAPPQSAVERQAPITMPQQLTNTPPAPQPIATRPDIASLSPQQQTSSAPAQAPTIPQQQPNQAIQSSQQTNPLPQPVAPFSSSSVSRPNSLGERVIHPLENISDNSAEISQMMSAALNETPNPLNTPTLPEAQTAQPSTANTTPVVEPQSQTQIQQPAMPTTPQPIDPNQVQNVR